MEDYVLVEQLSGLFSVTVFSSRISEWSIAYHFLGELERLSHRAYALHLVSFLFFFFSLSLGNAEWDSTFLVSLVSTMPVLSSLSSRMWSLSFYVSCHFSRYHPYYCIVFFMCSSMCRTLLILVPGHPPHPTPTTVPRPSPPLLSQFFSA